MSGFILQASDFSVEGYFRYFPSSFYLRV